MDSPLFGSKESSFFFAGLRKALQYMGQLDKQYWPLKKLFFYEQMESFMCCLIFLVLEYYVRLP